MTTALQEAPRTSYSLMDIPGCKFSSTQLEIEDGLEFVHWERIGRCLETAAKGVQWWIGDWLNYGESRYGEKYAQAIEETGFDKPTLMNYASVAKRVEISRRREIVDYSKHVEVAGLTPAQQKKVLAQAEKEKLTVKEVRRVATRIKRDEGKEPSEIELLQTPEVQEYLQRYLNTLKEFEEAVPLTARFLRTMFQNHSAQAFWQKNRSVAEDCEIIQMAVKKSGGEMEENDLYQWLLDHGYFMSDPEFEERLEYMNQDNVRMAAKTDAGEGKQENRRGKLPTIIAVPWVKVWEQSAKRERDEDDD